MLGFIRRIGRRDGMMGGGPEVARGMVVPFTHPTCASAEAFEYLQRTVLTDDSASGELCEGFALKLAIRLVEVVEDQLAPVANAMVEVWHCNAEGYYSGENKGGIYDASDVDWLRGFQFTNRDGDVKFETIFPGWTTSHAVHIGARVRRYDGSGQNVIFDETVKMFFKDGLATKIGMFAPYTSNFQARTLNGNDADYRAAVEAGLSGGMDLDDSAYLWPIVMLTETKVDARFHLVLAPCDDGQKLVCPV